MPIGWLIKESRRIGQVLGAQTLNLFEMAMDQYLLIPFFEMTNCQIWKLKMSPMCSPESFGKAETMSIRGRVLHAVILSAQTDPEPEVVHSLAKITQNRNGEFP